MAYNTRVKLQAEGAWNFTMWQPVLADSTDFDAYCDDVITRAAKHVEWRVGSTLYATSDTLIQAVLGEAELCLGQYYLLSAVAGIADTSDNSEQQPAIAVGPQLRGDAKQYKERFEEIIAVYDTQGIRGRRPTASYNVTTEEAVPNLEAEVDFEAPA